MCSTELLLLVQCVFVQKMLLWAPEMQPAPLDASSSLNYNQITIGSTFVQHCILLVELQSTYNQATIGATKTTSKKMHCNNRNPIEHSLLRLKPINGNKQTNIKTTRKRTIWIQYIQGKNDVQQTKEWNKKYFATIFQSSLLNARWMQ